MTGDRLRSRPITRLLLVVMGVFFGLVPGIWAAFRPASFYGDFPAIRPAWVAVDGPYNEHLIRDVGAMFLALAVIALVAAATGNAGQARLAGLAWLVFSVIHFAYHVTHLQVYESLDQWLNVVSQLASILISIAVLLIPPRRSGGTVRPVRQTGDPTENLEVTILVDQQRVSAQRDDADRAADDAADRLAAGAREPVQRGRGSELQ